MNLKIYRNKKGLTQAEAAKKINVSQNTYSNYETGITEPNIETLKKISKEFTASIDALVGNNIQQLDLSLISNTQKELIEEILKVTDTEALKMLAYLEGLKQGKKEMLAEIQAAHERNNNKGDN